MHVSQRCEFYERLLIRPIHVVVESFSLRFEFIAMIAIIELCTD